MSRYYSASKNKHPKINVHQYLNNSGEPRDDSDDDTPPELEVELLENSPMMRRRFRYIAQAMRSRYE